MSRFVQVYKPSEEGLGLAIVNTVLTGITAGLRIPSQSELNGLIREIGNEDALESFFDAILNSVKDKYKVDISKSSDNMKIWTDEYLSSLYIHGIPTFRGYHIELHGSTKSKFDKKLWCLVLFDKVKRWKDDSQCRMFDFQITDNCIVTREKEPHSDYAKYIDTKKLPLPFKVKFK